MKIAAAYIRVSTDDQIEYSPDSQLKAIRKYAKEHELILPEEFIYVDEGISGRKADKRPSFQRMIGTAKLKPKPFDVILLWKFSRFARNREDSIVYKSMLRKQCGIDVISISEQLGEDKTSILIEALIEAMDEYYSLNLAEEVKRGMNEKFSRGGVVSQPPFGYRMDKGVFVPDETNAPIVRMIYSDYISGMGARQIASKLNDMGVRTTKGNKFENRTVEYILTNVTYLGKLRRNLNGRDALDRFHESDDTVIVDGQHEPIIDADTYAAAQAKRKETKRAYGKYARQAPVEFMLKGMVRCSNCGATLVYQAAAKSLQCHNYARGACKVSHSITLKKADAVVVDRIRNDLSNLTFISSIDVLPAPKDDRSTALIALIEKEKKKLERIKEAYENGIDSLSEYKTNKEKITARIKELNTQFQKIAPKSFEEIKNDLIRRINTGLAIIDDPNASETVKNKAIRSFIDNVIYVKPRGVIEIHYKF
ncbi:MAG: recombinase family protein [Ruminococcus sp.]|nr:recombinase family protein [Ruminococcus sp.]